MEERYVLRRAPIAPVKRIRADQVERACNGPPIPHRQHEEHALPHALAQQREEAATQIGLSPFARARILVEMPEGVPMRLSDFRADEVEEVESVPRTLP